MRNLRLYMALPIDSPGRWWSIVPVALAVVLLFILLVGDWDEEFEI